MNKTPAIVGDQFVQLIDRFQNLDAVKLQQVIDAYTGMQDRQAAAEFNESMAALLAEIPAVVKDKDNPLFKSKYASHEAIMEALAPSLKKFGIGVRFGSESTGNSNVARPFLRLFKGLYSETHAIDIGVSSEGPKGGRPAMNVAQALGSGMTYARKYLLMNAFNLVLSEDDDDGNGVSNRPRSGLRDRAVADRMAQTHADENGNGNGNTHGVGEDGATRKLSVREWFDQFQAECDAADTVDEATQILQREQVVNCREVFAKWPDVAAAIEETKQALIRRVYQGDTSPSALGDQTPSSHVP